ncbi:hypothetical protein UlMin_017675, partial [Ulmus minor]
MGYLLKQVLKTLCGSNQWSYAVFWKIGCQNPKLLIWEEFYNEPSRSSLSKCISGAGSSDLPLGEWEGCWTSSEIQAVDRVSTLINNMMIRNQVNIVGEGIVGRAAFTGNHQWILLNNCNKFDHLPEVLNEMHHQLSAGIQTIAVVPVIPHGVVQFGSSLAIMENIGFVNDVKSLILQLGCVSGALLSDNYAPNNSYVKMGVPVNVGSVSSMDLSGIQKTGNTSPYVVDKYNLQINMAQSSSLVSQPSHSLVKGIRNNQETTTSTCEAAIGISLPKSYGNPCQPKISLPTKPNSSFGTQLKDVIVGAEVIPSSSSNVWLNQQASSYNERSGPSNLSGFSQSGASQCSLMMMEQKILSGIGVSNGFGTSQLRTNGSLVLDQDTPLLQRNQVHGGVSSYSGAVTVPCSISNTHMVADVILPGAPLAGVELRKADSLKTEVSSSFNHKQISNDVKLSQSLDNELFQALNIPLFQGEDHMSLSRNIPDFFHDFPNLDNKFQFPGSTRAKFEDECAQPSSGDDLFDILGVGFKNRILNCNGLAASTKYMHENNYATSESVKDFGSNLYSAKEVTSDSGMFSGIGADHLLDAVVSKAHCTAKQSSEDTMSCGTTLTKISSSSVPGSSLTYGRDSISNHVRGEMFPLPEPVNKAGLVKAKSFKSGCNREETGNCSQSTSVYGSQISSWVEQGSSSKQDNSFSTAFSKRPEETGKSNRKRLKPGENPRPRPKDRQMIQDRVKELREIVPNGGKCSIDALLERTIKHMLFLQSVTKHADKLKQTGESKIINKEGGLLLKDSFEGGATWAFEVGSQSMVCPIIVEDLNPPRQMLVEMLCEERGFFLEIADLIRGMGLTILKGVMEARDNKIWARFAIEANRDVTRMEIFMSLVHLLEQAAKGGGASSANAIENNTLMADTFAQIAPIPAT